jgi:hypothetical protein
MPDYGAALVRSGAMHHAISREEYLEGIFRDGKEPESSPPRWSRLAPKPIGKSTTIASCRTPGAEGNT